MLAFGKPGSGKTHAVCAIGQELIRSSGGWRNRSTSRPHSTARDVSQDSHEPFTWREKRRRLPLGAVPLKPLKTGATEGITACRPSGNLIVVRREV